MSGGATAIGKLRVIPGTSNQGVWGGRSVEIVSTLRPGSPEEDKLRRQLHIVAERKGKLVPGDDLADRTFLSYLYGIVAQLARATPSRQYKLDGTYTSVKPTAYYSQELEDSFREMKECGTRLKTAWERWFRRVLQGEVYNDNEYDVNLIVHLPQPAAGQSLLSPSAPTEAKIVADEAALNLVEEDFTPPYYAGYEAVYHSYKGESIKSEIEDYLEGFVEPHRRVILGEPPEGYDMVYDPVVPIFGSARFHQLDVPIPVKEFADIVRFRPSKIDEINYYYSGRDHALNPRQNPWSVSMSSKVREALSQEEIDMFLKQLVRRTYTMNEPQVVIFEESTTRKKDPLSSFS
jgi:hypothetical protein